MGVTDFFSRFFGLSGPGSRQAGSVGATPPSNDPEWNRTWDDQIKWLAYPFDLIRGADAEAAYLAAREKGRVEGFSPLVLAPGLNLVPNMPRERLLAEAEAILARVRPAAEYFAEAAPLYENKGEDDDDEEGDGLALFDRLRPREPSARSSGMHTPHDKFGSSTNTFSSHAEVALVRVPTPRSWEIPAYFLFGGWNFIASPEQMVAVAKYWHERWGAEICGICQESLEFRVARKPASHAEAVALLREHYLFCSEMEFDRDLLEERAAELRVMDYWFFWWD